jgi:hypothetical protein
MKCCYEIPYPTGINKRAIGINYIKRDFVLSTGDLLLSRKRNVRYYDGLDMYIAKGERRNDAEFL